jgi:hypothetical protein
MKVTLNVENDAELRAHIKYLIKGQILSIVREDFLEIVKEEIERKIKGTDENLFNHLFGDAMINVISNILRDKCEVSQWSNKFIEPIILKRINPIIESKDWNKLVDGLAIEKVRKLLENKK